VRSHPKNPRIGRYRRSCARFLANACQDAEVMEMEMEMEVMVKTKSKAIQMGLTMTVMAMGTLRT
jgi:hypothetical protein